MSVEGLPTSTPVGRPRRTGQRGVSLIEALVAMGVMAFGMLGVVGMQATLRTNADVAKQRAEAVRIAQAAVEDWRAFETLAPAGGACAVSPVPPAFDCIANVAATAVTGYTTNTSYIYTATVQPPALAASAPRLKTFAVNVAWADRNGQAQSVGLISSVAGIAPEISGSLGLPNDRAATQRPRGMHPGLPPGVVDQGNGTSTFVPTFGAPTYVFANLSGVITSVCNPFPSTCVAVTALPLSGFIRFATGTTLPTGADAETPPSPAFAVGVDIVSLTMPITPAIPPVCYTSVAVGFVSYFCAVPTTTTTPYLWTGRSELVGFPTAAALPTSPPGTALTDATPTNFKVCRYTPVRSHTPPGGNADHPLNYGSVTVPLANQNFLVIRAGDGTTPFQCPPDLSGTPVNGNTYYHQPSG